MEIDLDWIQKELDAGREVELECVDREGYEKRHRLNKTLFREGSCLEVLEVWGDGAINLKRLVDSPMDGLHLIPPHEFGHFRIKRPVPTFDDLIDVALTALKDRVLSGVELEHDGVESLRYWTDKRSDCNVIFAQHNNYQDGIDFINSLYTETFVIEGGSCILKINENIQALVLANGCDIVDRVYFEGGSMRLRDCFGNSISLTNLNILKGATVTQKRGK